MTLVEGNRTRESLKKKPSFPLLKYCSHGSKYCRLNWVRHFLILVFKHFLEELRLTLKYRILSMFSGKHLRLQGPFPVGMAQEWWWWGGRWPLPTISPPSSSKTTELLMGSRSQTWSAISTALKQSKLSQAVVTKAFNFSTQEGEAGGSLRLRPA